MQPPELLPTFISPLEESKICYFITGSIASIYYGEPRLTHDIDLVLNLSSQDVPKIVALFPMEKFYCPPADVIEIEIRRRPFGHFNLIHHESGFKADIYTDAGDPLHHWAFGKRKRIVFSDSLSVWLAPAEYIFIRKLEFYREGKSEKHLEDIRKMLVLLTKRDLDNSFLEAEITKRGLSPFWALV